MSAIEANVPLGTVADLISLTSMEGLVNYQSTSPLGRLFSQVEFEIRLENALHASGLNPNHILTALRQFHCILAGQFVLKLLDPLGLETYRRIDIISGYSDYRELFYFFRRTCHAIMQRRIWRVPDFPSASYRYAAIFKFPDSNMLVRVIRATHDDPHLLIPQYPATHLMNYIAGDHLVVAYPSLTFSRRSIQVREHIPASLTSSFTLGSRCEVLPNIHCATSPMCGSVFRAFDDAQSVVLGCISDEFVVGEEVEGDDIDSM
ncbi:hypothetical protein BC629DRAFT_1468393 [Irpex lacteus]|nr:hypothetical protein BC629DRAFT_1468393 [Irpex lacteus]